MPKVVHFPSTWRWQPFAMPSAFPVPLVRPAPLELAEALVVHSSDAHLLSLGLGRVDMDLRWMWTWDRDGVLRLFRSWTGREVFRLRLTPVDLVPGGRWRVAAAEVEEGTDPGTTESMLRSVLASVRGVRGALEDVPLDRESALRRGRDKDAPPLPTDDQAQDVGRRLPLCVVELRMLDRVVPIPSDLLLVDARAQDDALQLRFSDGSLLWLHQAWRVAVDDTLLATDVGSVLLWPAAGWPLSEAVGAWRVLRTHGVREEARDPDGRPLQLDALAPEQPLPRPDTLVHLSLAAVRPSDGR